MDVPGHTLLLWLLLAALTVGALIGAALAALLWRQVQVRRRAESVAARARADLMPLDRALRHSTEAVLVTDVNRRITWVNEAFERITGFGATEVLGCSPGQLLQFDGTDADTVARMRLALDAGEPFVGEILNRGRHGRAYWLQLDIQPLRDATGRLSGFVAIQADITARKAAEAELRANEALLANTGRIAGVGGWVYEPASGQLRCTRQLADMLGLPAGRAPRLRDGLRLFGRGERRALWRLAAPGAGCEASEGLDLQVAAATGEPRWLHVTVEATPAADGSLRITGAALDVTQRRAMKAQLQHSADLLRGAFEAIDEAFALFDPQDRLVFCNERYREVYAASREFIVPGARFEDIVRRGAEAGQYEAARGRVDDWVAQHMAAHRDGDRTLVQRLSDGRILRVVDRTMADGHTVGFRVDITELVRATEISERADKAKSEFIATVSHELRTPLQVITGFSDLGRHFGRGHAQFEPMFEDIHAAGTRMLTLVNGLLDVSKIDGTVGSLVLKRHDLAALAQTVVRELRQLAADRGVDFAVDIVPVPLPVDVDAFRLQQVLRNVLANAIRFAPPGTEVRIEGRDRGAAGVEWLVRDRGPGIPPDELESVFEPFVQSSRTSDGSGGTGLGLAICRRIMGAHGGRIAAEAPPEGGALIRLWLPPAAPLPAGEGNGPRLLRSNARPRAPEPPRIPSTDNREQPCPTPS